MPHIAVVNESSLLTDSQVDTIAAALQRQANLHIAKAWGLAQVGISRKVPGLADWQLVFLDDSDQAGALGYHDDLSTGLPLMRVFVRTCRQDRVSESSCASHEVAEALVDPYLNTASFDGRSKFWATEVGDPVQRGSYSVLGVEVSNFVTPAWFNPNATRGFDHLGQVSAPFQVATGGYSQFLDITNPSKGWQQIGEELGGDHARPEQRRTEIP